MHDQRKAKEEIDEKTREQHLVKIKEFRALYDSLLKQREQHVVSEAVLEQLSLLLQKNPEAYSMYNYRRNILLHNWKMARERAVGDANDTTETKADVMGATAPVMMTPTTTTTAPSTCEGAMEREQQQQQSMKRELNSLSGELKLNTTILLKDYKVYAAFTHRRWIFAQISRLAEESITSAKPMDGGEGRGDDHDDKRSACFQEEVIRTWWLVLQSEKQQCDALLAMDERNFHVWNYRRWALGELEKMERFLSQHSINLDLTPPSKSNVEDALAAPPMPPRPNRKQQGRQSDGEDAKHSSLLFTPDEIKELRFTTAMVKRNFSNYSAWHQRGVILKRALQRLQGAPNDDDSDAMAARVAALTEAWTQLGEDLELIVTAIYCDPVDQSAWYYAQFLTWAADLLGCIPLTHPPARVNVTARLIETCIDLMAEEKRMGDGDMEAYWPRFYLFITLLSVSTTATGRGSNSKEKAVTVRGLVREVRAALSTNEVPDNAMKEDEEICAWCTQKLAQQLVLADPLRQGMYRGLLAHAATYEG